MNTQSSEGEGSITRIPTRASAGNEISHGSSSSGNRREKDLGSSPQPKVAVPFVAIPAMDIIDGACVRLRMGDYTSKHVYHTEPLEMAKAFVDAGLGRLHLVDLDGAKAGHTVNLKVLESIATHTDLIVDVGGGLQSPQDFASVFSAGAWMATVGSIAAKDRETTLSILATWGAKRLILGADCKDGMIAVSGWTAITSLHVLEFILSYLREGFSQVVSTDIGRDGMLNGPAVELYRDLLLLAQSHSLKMDLIASGGIRSISDLDVLRDMGLSGAIVGKALYEGLIDPKELSTWQSGVEV